MLNPALKGHLESLFGAVTIHSENEPAQITFVRYPGGDYFRPRKGEYYAITCPFCGRRGKLWVSHTFGTTIKGVDGVPVKCVKKVFHCFRCEFDKKNKDQTRKFIDALEKGVTDGIQVDLDAVMEASAKKIDVPSVFPHAYPLMDSFMTFGAEYVASRGFDPVEVEKTWGGRLTNDFRFFGHPYVVFPIFRHGVPCTWQARRIGDDDSHPKYYFDPAGRKSEFLFNMDRARHSSVGVLVEGIFDAMRVGPLHALATFGKVPSARQTSLLKSLYRYGTLIVAYDRDFLADSEALTATWRAAGLFKNVYNIVFPDERDPGDYETGDLWNLIKAQTGVSL